MEIKEVGQMEKIRYEKPVSVPLGAVAPIAGASLCTTGADPNVLPGCTPGNVATNLCSKGSTNNDGNCRDGGWAFGICKEGGTGATWPG